MNPPHSHKTLKPVLFVIVYHAPGPYSEFLSEFSEFLPTLVISADKIIILSYFNIHVDIESDASALRLSFRLSWLCSEGKETHSLF